MPRTTYQNITYKLCPFGTVHCTYRYCTYGWLVTRNLCRELHIIQYILVDRLLSYDATYVASWLSKPLILWCTYKILWVHLLDILGTRTPILFHIVGNLCREVTELMWHHNITLWFTSVPNIVMSRFVFLRKLYTNIIIILSPILERNLCRKVNE